MTEIIRNKGETFDEQGFVIVNSQNEEFKKCKKISKLMYACKSSTLLPEEMRRIMNYIKDRRNAAAHVSVLRKDDLREFMNAFNAFVAWYYFESEAYKKDPHNRVTYFAKRLDAKLPKEDIENSMITDEIAEALKKVSISSAKTSMNRLEQVITNVVHTEIKKGIVEVTDVVKTEAGEIKEKIDALSKLVMSLAEKIGDYQSLVERQLNMATTEDEKERIIHA